MAPVVSGAKMGRGGIGWGGLAATCALLVRMVSDAHWAPALVKQMYSKGG